MTQRERVICSLQHKQPDFIPYNASCTIPMHERMAEYAGTPDYINTWGCALHRYDAGAPVIPAPGYPDGYVQDEFGVIWNRSGADKDIGVIVGAVIPEIDGWDYQFPEIEEERIRTDVEQLLATAGDRFTVAGIGFSMFERAWTLCTMEETLMGMITDPEELERLFDAICDYDMKIINILCEYPVDCIRFGDDWGQQRGLIMGPDHWRRFIKPRMARLYKKVHESGKFVLQHSCGDVREIMDDLIEIGLDCYETFQPEIYDFETFKNRWGDRLSIFGGISTQQCLPCCTPEEVKKETVRLLKIIGRDGGLIAGPTHDIPGDVPPENIMAMLEVLQNQENYLK